jgi:SAM-dependent methyltransferase
MAQGYAYDHAWAMERVRLAGLEAALDPGTREHLTRLGVGPGTRCLEIGAGGGSVAFWLASRVVPGGTVVATDLQTGFLESEAAAYPGLEVLRHDITAAELPGGFDVVHARWLVEWLPDKRRGLRRMVSALRPGGVLLIEEPDFVTIFEAGELAVRRVIAAMVRHATHWITNVKQGGRPVSVVPDATMRDLALRATAAVGANFAGVDILYDADGQPTVLEVNSMPAWSGLQRVTRANIASILAADLVAALAQRGHREAAR